MKQAIGIFDSGVGGLTVVKEIYKNLPNENILYFGDTARVPYGGKSPEEILSIVREIIDWMLQFDVKAVAMACNTSSALALDIVRTEYSIPIFGLIKPTANFINNSSELPRKVGVIATAATVKSKAYSKAIKKLCPEVEVVEVGCPGLVEIVESGEVSSKLAYREVKKYMDPLILQKADKVVLGCTHYPYLSEVITKVSGRENILINPAEHMVLEMKQVLEKTGMLNTFNPNPNRDFYVSAAPMQFISVGTKLLPGVLNSSNVMVEIPSIRQKLAAS